MKTPVQTSSSVKPVAHIGFVPESMDVFSVAPGSDGLPRTALQPNVWTDSAANDFVSEVFKAFNETPSSVFTYIGYPDKVQGISDKASVHLQMTNSLDVRTLDPHDAKIIRLETSKVRYLVSQELPFSELFSIPCLAPLTMFASRMRPGQMSHSTIKAVTSSRCA